MPVRSAVLLFIVIISLLLAACAGTAPTILPVPDAVEQPVMAEKTPETKQSPEAEQSSSVERTPEAELASRVDQTRLSEQYPGAEQSPETEPLVSRDSESQYIAFLKSSVPLAEKRELEFRVFPPEARIRVPSTDGILSLSSIRVEKDISWYLTDATAVLIDAPGFVPAAVSLPIETERIEMKLERPPELVKLLDETGTRRQPKSVRFAADGRSVYIANLADRVAMSEYSVEPLKRIRDFQVPDSYRDDLGFVETVILPGRGEIWLSQMTRNTIHVFDTESGTHLAAIPLSGIWPKVLLASSDEQRVYASCWDSDSVVEIDTTTRRELRSFDVGPTPRGLAFSADGSELLVTLFDSSIVERVDLKSGKQAARYDAAPGRIWSMRHITHDRERSEYYITAMGVGRVLRMSEEGEWLGFWYVGDKPNTCAISPDGSRLFVSCRGPNNPDTGYLNKGYEFGKVYIINLVTSRVEGWIWGRDQTTGLDISPDGRLLAFSDFLSANLELYEIR